MELIFAQISWTKLYFWQEFYFVDQLFNF